jgi:hypothetical protein
MRLTRASSVAGASPVEVSDDPVGSEPLARGAVLSWGPPEFSRNVKARATVTSVIASAIQRKAALDVTADTKTPDLSTSEMCTTGVWGSERRLTN